MQKVIKVDFEDQSNAHAPNWPLRLFSSRKGSVACCSALSLFAAGCAAGCPALAFAAAGCAALALEA